MNRLVELAYKKLLATRGSFASKSGIPKVSKNVALAFAKRTLDRCRAFEDSGISCLNEPLFRDVLFAAPTPREEAEPSSCLGPRVGSFDKCAEQRGPHGNINGESSFLFGAYQQPDQGFTNCGHISHRGKKKEVLLDDVGGGAAFRSTSTLGGALLAGTKGKRSERERDKETSSRNATAKPGPSSLSTSKGDRKTKAKPKQKTPQLSASGNASVNKLTETTRAGYALFTEATCAGYAAASENNRQKDVTHCSLKESSEDIEEPLDLTNFPLPELDSIDELGVGTDLGGHQDLSSWFTFDEDGLQDQDIAMEGLEIPMDDIADLNMF